MSSKAPLSYVASASVPGSERKFFENKELMVNAGQMGISLDGEHRLCIAAPGGFAALEDDVYLKKLFQEDLENSEEGSEEDASSSVSSGDLLTDDSSNVTREKYATYSVMSKNLLTDGLSITLRAVDRNMSNENTEKITQAFNAFRSEVFEASKKERSIHSNQDLVGKYVQEAFTNSEVLTTIVPKENVSNLQLFTSIPIAQTIGGVTDHSVTPTSGEIPVGIDVRLCISSNALVDCETASKIESVAYEDTEGEWVYPSFAIPVNDEQNGCVGWVPYHTLTHDEVDQLQSGGEVIKFGPLSLAGRGEIKSIVLTGTSPDTGTQGQLTISPMICSDANSYLRPIEEIQLPSDDEVGDSGEYLSAIAFVVRKRVV